MDLFITIFYFLIAVCLLIFVHELGHFLMARLFGVKVLKFSLGFGPSLIAYTGRFGTTYTLSAVPVGGYVKMLDEDEGQVSPEDLPFAFNRKPPLVKILIAFAGPLFNLLFALFLLTGVYLIGITELSPIVSTVNVDSAAYQSGIKSNDEFITIANHPTSNWMDVRLQLASYMGSRKPILIEVKQLKSPKVRTLNLDLSQLTVNASQEHLFQLIGFEPFIPKITPIVGSVVNNGSAFKAGVKINDEILSVDGHRIDDWLFLVDYVQKHPESVIHLTVKRGTHKLNLEVFVSHKIQGKKKMGYIGLAAKPPSLAKEWFKLNQYPLLPAIKQAANQTWQLSFVSFKMLVKLFTGQMSIKHIGGPIGIAQGARRSAENGMAYYLAFLALVSVSLAVLNLLPIPVLDGGHILFYLVEYLVGKPVGEVTRNSALLFGVLFLLMLTGLAFYNDIIRLLGQ